jgi:cytochrome c7-like protein
MAQIFHRSANTVARLSILTLVLVGAGLGAGLYQLQRSSWVTRQYEAHVQNPPFSHQHHVGGMGIDCRYCHTSVETSGFAGIPPTKTCMNCHSQIWTNAPMLEPVRASFRNGTSLDWTRVHDLPDFVYFDHSIHVNKGVGCQSCHGQVDKMPFMYEENSLQMEWCLECHRAPEKNLRPKQAFEGKWVEQEVASGSKMVAEPKWEKNPEPTRELVFSMLYKQPSFASPLYVEFAKHPEWNGKYTEQTNAAGTGLGDRLKIENNIRSERDITSCSTCHR